MAAALRPLVVRLDDLDDRRWEALCDGCGRCCLCKFEDEERGEMLYTDLACPLLDVESCRCRDYPRRRQSVADCLDIRGFSDTQFRWLPPTCAYRLAHEGRPLPEWHPWVSGDADSVHFAGVSVRGKVAGSCAGLSEEELIAHIVG